MCVFKYHAFIFCMRPPRWQSETLRNVLIKIVSDSGIRNTRVVDSCPVTKCRSTDYIVVRLTNLKDVSSSDGVHFTREGLSNMASICISTLYSATVRAEKSSITVTKKSGFYWRGFKSHRGASKMSAAAARLARLNSQQQARPPPPATAGQPTNWEVGMAVVATGVFCATTTHTGNKRIRHFSWARLWCHIVVARCRCHVRDLLYNFQCRCIKANTIKSVCYDA
jgi:hypothetical protein